MAKRGRKPKHVLKVDKVTGEVLERYGSALDAAEENGMTPNMMYTILKERMLTSDRLTFRFGCDYDPHEEFGTKRNKPIVCFDIKDRCLVGVYPNNKAVQDELLVSQTTVSKACREGIVVAGSYMLRRLERMGEVMA